jgi:hypothetical protein
MSEWQSTHAKFSWTVFAIVVEAWHCMHSGSVTPASDNWSPMKRKNKIENKNDRIRRSPVNAPKPYQEIKPICKGQGSWFPVENLEDLQMLKNL